MVIKYLCNTLVRNTSSYAKTSFLDSSRILPVQSKVQDMPSCSLVFNNDKMLYKQSRICLKLISSKDIRESFMWFLTIKY